VNLDTQEVVVKGTIPYEDVLARIKKTGKEVCSVFLWEGILLVFMLCCRSVQALLSSRFSG